MKSCKTCKKKKKTTKICQNCFTLFSNQDIHQHIAIGLKRITFHMAYELKQMIMKLMFMLHKVTLTSYDGFFLYNIFQNISKYFKFATEVKITSSLENETGLT